MERSADLDPLRSGSGDTSLCLSVSSSPFFIELCFGLSGGFDSGGFIAG